MNTQVMFSSKSDEWATPQSFFEELNEEFHFTLDPCANSENHKCDKWFNKEQNGLSADWGGMWCSAIHHIQKLKNGLPRLFMKAGRTTRLWFF